MSHVTVSAEHPADSRHPLAAIADQSAEHRGALTAYLPCGRSGFPMTENTEAQVPRVKEGLRSPFRKRKPNPLRTGHRREGHGKRHWRSDTINSGNDLVTRVL